MSADPLCEGRNWYDDQVAVPAEAPAELG